MPPPSAVTPISRNFISQRLRLHYVDWGNPDAPPLLLIHGGRDHCRSWDWVARRLCNRWHVIAPDLRGHGESAWSTGSTYMIAGHIYDLAQLIHQQKLAPVSIIAHSLGGQIALRYTGLYPETVRQIVAVEGLGQNANHPRSKLTAAQRAIEYVEATRKLAAHTPRRYATVAEAVERMKAANKRLSDEQAQHLTVHAVAQNEDGTYSWKYDPYVRPWAPYDMTPADVQSLWARVTCPVLHMWGTESWHTDPVADGRVAIFPNAQAKCFEGSGHWIHHDQLEPFMAAVEGFLQA